MKPDQLSWARAWSLITKHHEIWRSHFSRELIACIFWEESGFVYSKVNKGSGALGIGQVMPNNLKTINERYKTNFTKQDVLGSDEFSVEFAVIALELCWDWKRSKAESLKCYSGYPLNQGAVSRWNAAVPELLKANLTTDENQTFDQAQIIKALKLCSQPGWNPADIF